MKKYLLIGLVLCFWSAGVWGQDATATMLEQLVAWKACVKTVEKGYEIAGKGLAVIQDIRKGEFDLHAAYFQSLLKGNDGLAMTDGERMLRVNGVEDEERLKRQWQAWEHFTRTWLNDRQNSEAAEITLLRNLYGSP